MDGICTQAGMMRRGGYDPAAADWFVRIATAGSSINDNNKSVANDLFVGLRSAGLLSVIVDLGLFAGPADLTGARVKAIDQLGNGMLSLSGASPFTNSDHSSTGGITAKADAYLESATDLSNFTQNDFAMGVSVTSVVSPATGRSLSIGGADDTGIRSPLVGSGDVRAVMRSNTQSTLVGNSTGFIGVTRSAAGSFEYDTFGNTGSIATTSTVISAGNTKIFASFSGGNILTSGALGGYFLAPAIGSAGLATLRSLLNTYMASLT